MLDNSRWLRFEWPYQKPNIRGFLYYSLGLGVSYLSLAL